MFDDRTVGRKELAGILLIAGVIVALVITALVQSYDPQAPSKSNPAEGAARQVVDQIYQEELATAKAAALLKAEARQAEVNATEELLNSFENTSPSLAEGLPPKAEAETADPPVATRLTPSSAPTQAPDLSVTASSVRAEDGQTVNVENIIKSVRDAGAKAEKND